MKTTELRFYDSCFDSECAQAQESEYFCHRGEPARRYSATYSTVVTDKDIDDIGWKIADWSFDSDPETVEKIDFADFMHNWAENWLYGEDPAFFAVLTFAYDEIYESYAKWMDAFRREYCICEDEEEEDEVDE